MQDLNGITQLSDQKFRVVVTKRIGGKKVFRERTVGSLAEAILARAALQQNIEVKAETFAVACERIIAAKLAKGRLRPHTAKKMRILAQMLKPLLQKDVRKLNHKDIEMWVSSLHTLKKDDGRPYSYSTLVGVWNLLRTICNRLVAEGALKSNPCNQVEFIRGATRRRETLTEDELNRLLAATSCCSPDIAALIWLLATTGMRFGEASSLTWEDINFGEDFICVSKSQVGGYVGLTKTGKERTVPLHPKVKEMLAGIKADGASELVFPSKNGNYRYTSVLIKPLAECCQRARINKHVTAHVLRRAANDLLRRHAGETVAMAVLGHVTQAMHRHYATVHVDEGRRAFAALVG
jgi:integrase